MNQPWRSFAAAAVLFMMLPQEASTIRPAAPSLPHTGTMRVLPADDLMVFDDTLRPPWSDASWNAIVSYGNTEQARTGTSSIKVVLTVAWGFLSMHHGEWNSAGIDPDLYESVDFDLYAPTSETSVTVFFENDQGQTFPRINSGTPVEQTWVTVSLPISQLNPNGYTIHRICLQEFSGTLKSFYIDNLRFVAANGADAPAPPLLATPPDSAAGISLDPVFTWHPSPGADSYRLQVSTSGLFGTTEVDEPAIADTQRAISGLANSTTYFWRTSAQNDAGTSGWSQVRSFKTVPGLPNAPTLASPPDGAINQDTALVIRWNQVPGADSYRLQLATTSDFFTPLRDDPLIAGTTLPVDGLSSNTKYFWRVRSRNSAGTSGWSGAWSFVTTAPDSSPGVLILQTTIPFPERSRPSQYSQEDYRIVGLPGASNAPIASILPGDPGRHWQVYWDNGSAADYMVAHDGGPEFVFRPGRAFWMIKTSPWVIDMSVPPCTLTPAREVLIEIHDGWNLITNPFLNPISWQVVQSLNESNELIYEFVNGGFAVSETMEPFKGFYFYNDTGTDTLRFQLDPTSRGPSTRPAVAAGDSDWQVSVRLRSGETSDQSLWFGVREEAQDGKDPADVRKPGVRAKTSLSFHRPDWDSVHSYFASDIRATGNPLNIWQIHIAAPKGLPAELAFTGVGEVPEELEVCLCDASNRAGIDLRFSSVYHFLPGETPVSMSLLVGTPERIKEHLRTSAAPGTYELKANYPNPFNASTTIPFTLARDSRVSITIHNALGQKVRTLVEGRMVGGSHNTQWDGTDDDGGFVSSGVYFYRLTVEPGTVLTRSLVLVK